MALILGTPIAVTNTQTSVQITGLVNNLERGNIEVHYMTLLEDGTPYQRGMTTYDGYDEVKNVYAEIDAVIATGKTFEEASTEILYTKVIAHLGA